ncbi:GT2 family glycosyltransferase [Alkalihalobacillus xiaoxiensis]|uniref:GT2 family glycosyltransferase n=1 Tax=Shouchella xiaoxiensis TaxID=766895 RepID=A0ABS2SWX0_9BACI|nr:glycosyltransferase family 2 protein [Shouchella xiaoxiensis]MBM7840032.1 GT2 family glycosyltransferase [Shouchella xiaoxiensis]
MKLVPLDVPNDETNKWFLVDGVRTSGWVYLSLNYSGQRSFPVKLYWDLGSGFKEKHSEELGIIDAKLEGNQPSFCYLPPEAKQLAISFEKTEKTPYELVLEAINPVDVGHFYTFSWAHTVKTFPIKLNGQVVPTSYLKYRSFKLIENTRDINSLAFIASPQISDGLAAYYFNDYQDEVPKEAKSLISVIIPVYQVDLALLKQAIDSISKQTYQTIELIVVVHQKMHERIKEMEDTFKTNRWQMIFYNGGGQFSELANEGVRNSKGKRVILLHPHDQLTTKGLSLLAEREADIVYGDEVHYLPTGQVIDCYRKPAWSPDLFLAHHYISSGVLFSKELYVDVGGLRKEKEGAAEYDLLLRMTENANSVKNVSKAVYKKRIGASSTSYEGDLKGISEVAKEVVRETLDRRSFNAEVSTIDEQANLFHVKYKLKPLAMVSIIICTRDKAELMRVCLQSIFEKTTYANFEVIVVDNGSKDEATFALFDQWKEAEPERFLVIRDERPFNFSALNNRAAKQARGDLLLMLNNDMEVITPDWLEEMAGLAIQERVGAVGAMLYYSENHVQHAGAVFNQTAPIHSFYKGFLTDNDLSKLLKVNRNFLAVTGACLMVKKKLYEEVGGLDEQFQSSYNDMHFCMQLHELGKDNVFAARAELYHYESVSRGRLQTYETQVEWMKELGRFRSLWAPYFQYDPYAGSHTF